MLLDGLSDRVDISNDEQRKENDPTSRPSHDISNEILFSRPCKKSSISEELMTGELLE